MTHEHRLRGGSAILVAAVGTFVIGSWGCCEIHYVRVPELAPRIRLTEGRRPTWPEDGELVHEVRWGRPRPQVMAGVKLVLDVKPNKTRYTPHEKIDLRCGITNQGEKAFPVPQPEVSWYFTHLELRSIDEQGRQADWGYRFPYRCVPGVSPRPRERLHLSRGEALEFVDSYSLAVEPGDYCGRLCYVWELVGAPVWVTLYSNVFRIDVEKAAVSEDSH